MLFQQYGEIFIAGLMEHAPDDKETKRSSVQSKPIV